MNPQIKTYIDTERSRGISDVQIKQTLVSQGGWSEGEINFLFMQGNDTSSLDNKVKNNKILLYIEIGLIVVFILFKLMTMQFASYSEYVYQDFPVNSDVYCTETYPELNQLSHEQRMNHLCHQEHQKKIKEITEPRIKKHHQIGTINLILQIILVLYTLFFVFSIYKKHDEHHDSIQREASDKKLSIFLRPKFWVLLVVQTFLILDIIYHFIYPVTTSFFSNIFFIVFIFVKIFFSIYFFIFLYKNVSISKEKFVMICVILHIVSFSYFFSNTQTGNSILQKIGYHKRGLSFSQISSSGGKALIPCNTGTYYNFSKKACLEIPEDPEVYKKYINEQEKKNKLKERFVIFGLINNFFLIFSTINLLFLSTILHAKKNISFTMYTIALVVVISTTMFFVFIFMRQFLHIF